MHSALKNNVADHILLEIASVPVNYQNDDAPNF